MNRKRVLANFMKKFIIPALLISFVLLVAGCAQTSAPAENRTLYSPPEGSSYLQIISPQNGDVINSSTVGVRVNVTNFRLAAITNRPNYQNEGHIHYSLDGEEKMSSLTTFAFSDVPEGTHTLRVELRNNDHSPLAIPVATSVIITVRKDVGQLTGNP